MKIREIKNNNSQHPLEPAYTVLFNEIISINLLTSAKPYKVLLASIIAQNEAE